MAEDIGKEGLPLEVETPTLTTEEQLKTLQTELEKSKQELTRLQNFEKGYKGLQETINRKDAELKKQVDLRTEIAEIKETQKIFAAMLAEKGEGEETPEGIPQGRKQDLLKQYERIEQEQKAKRVAAETTRRQEEYNTQADTVWQRAATLGLTESDDDYWFIYDALSRDGNLRKAEAKVKKLESSKTLKTTESPPPPQGETEEERIERLVNERLQEKPKSGNLLKTDTVAPSGRISKQGELTRQVAEGEKTITQALKDGWVP